MQELIQKIGQGDQKACRILYDKFSSAMYSICLRYAKNDMDAVDLLQDSFVKIFNHIHKLENADVLPAWIKKITINTCLKYIESNNKIKWEEFDDKIQLHKMDSDHQDEFEQEYAQQIQSIQNAINDLPEKYKIVFNLHVYDDYTHEEIAELLGLVSSTVRSQYMRAKQKLIQSLNQNKSNGRSSQGLIAAALL
ncbi:MAG TPA: sigma-70 family RNA polymerase sigma factor [Saprospiraceae bacterium]|nr:sigma-70 family RNA polymerase sigma factor [Saprospiraceae bacterium]